MGVLLAIELWKQWSQRSRARKMWGLLLTHYESLPSDRKEQFGTGNELTCAERKRKNTWGTLGRVGYLVKAVVRGIPILA